MEIFYEYLENNIYELIFEPKMFNAVALYFDETISNFQILPDGFVVVEGVYCT